MKLASLRSRDKKNRDGELIVVSRDNRSAFPVTPSMSLTQALEIWDEVRPELLHISERLNKGAISGACKLNVEDCIAPLPDSPGFYDGSAFLSHVYRARKSRGDEMPESAKTTPLMYQGVSDHCLSHHAPIDLMDVSFGGDFEGEFGVITGDVPKSSPVEKMDEYIILLTLFNDITYRMLVKTELETKFGFLQSKPNSAFAPFVVTPDELGDAWKDGRVCLELVVKLNGELFGHPNGREMHFSFHQLVAHACRTRPLSAGSIVGGGTVSNQDKSVGFACLTEKRFQEILDQGQAKTPWLKEGDRVFMDVTRHGVSVFGCIHEKVVIGA